MPTPTLAEQSATLERAITAARNAENQYGRFQANVTNDMRGRLQSHRKIGLFQNREFRMLTSGMIQRFEGTWKNWSDGAKVGVTPWIPMSAGTYFTGAGYMNASLRMAFRNRNIKNVQVGFDIVLCPTRMPNPQDPNNKAKSVGTSQAFVNGLHKAQGIRFIPGTDPLEVLRKFGREQRHPHPKHHGCFNQRLYVRFFTYRHSDKKYGVVTFKEALNHPHQHAFFLADEAELWPGS